MKINEKTATFHTFVNCVKYVCSDSNSLHLEILYRKAVSIDRLCYIDIGLFKLQLCCVSPSAIRLSNITAVLPYFTKVHF